MRTIVLALTISVSFGACSSDGDSVGVQGTTSPSVAETTSTFPPTTGSAPALAEARQVDVAGWVERFDLDVPVTEAYPVVTVTPDVALGTMTIDGRQVRVDADTEFHDNCLVVTSTVRTPAERARPMWSTGCFLLVGLDDDESADWVVTLGRGDEWLPDDTGRWTPTGPIEESLPALRLVDVVDGAYVIDAETIVYRLDGVGDPDLGPDCPPFNEPDFFGEPGMYHSAIVDTATAEVVGVSCEFQYSD